MDGEAVKLFYTSLLRFFWEAPWHKWPTLAIDVAASGPQLVTAHCNILAEEHSVHCLSAGGKLKVISNDHQCFIDTIWLVRSTWTPRIGVAGV